MAILFLVAVGRVSATKDVVTSIETDANVILHDMAWKPDGSYALIVGDKGTVLKYNGTSAVAISPDILKNTTSDLYGVAWNPNGSYALIVGHNYTMLKYDGVNPIELINTTITDSYGVAWAPNGSFALISGLSGKVLKYDGTNITELNETYGGLRVSYNQNSDAIIVGEECGIVLGYNGTNITLINNSTATLLSNLTQSQNVAWHPSGSYAMIVGMDGFAAKYENSNFSEIKTSTTENLWGIAWCPVSNYALITGSNGALLKYDGVGFFKVRDESGKNLFKVAWKPGSNEAVIVGYYDKQLPDATIIQKGLIMKFISNGSADPYLALSQISTSPPILGINESALVIVDITNIDPYSDTGTLNILFSLNDSVLDNKSVILDPAEKRTVLVTYYANFTPGEYVLKVAVLNATLPTIYNVTKNITILASLNVTATITLDPPRPLDVNETVNIGVRVKNNNSALTTTVVNATVYLDNTTVLVSKDFPQIKPTETVYMNCTWNTSSAGNYTISVKIKTQNNIVNETTKQIVVKTKSTEVTNNPPQIDSISNRTITLGTLFTLSVSDFANDPDNDILTYTLESPAGANLTINSTTGRITGTPITTGIFTIKVTVTDGKNSTNTTFTLNVNAKEEEKIKTTSGFLPAFEALCVVAAIGVVLFHIKRRRY
jgi:hypothetical protein